MNYHVIIPSKTLSNLVPCVAAVRKCEPGLEPVKLAGGLRKITLRDLPLSRIVVVDDGVFEGRQDAITAHAYPEGIRWLKGQKPFVFSRNINIGIREAMQDPDLDGVILLNDDALLESPGGFTLLAEEAAAHPEYGLIGATTNKTGQPLQWRRNQRRCPMCLNGQQANAPCWSCKGTGVDDSESMRVGLREVPHIAFVCVYIPVRTLKTVGLLDTRYALPGKYGCEDLDYCEAVTRAGLKVGVHDGCYVDHASLKSSFRGDPSAPGDFLPHLELCIAKWGGGLQCHPTAVNLLRRTA